MFQKQFVRYLIIFLQKASYLNLNLNLMDDRLEKQSGLVAVVSPESLIIIIIIIFFNIKLTNATMCTIIKQMEQSIYKMQSI